MSKSSRRTFTGDFRQFFFRGLTILLPSVLTIWILVQAYRFVDQNIAQPINGICRVVVVKSTPLIYRDASKRPNWYHITEAELKAERDRRVSENLPELNEDDLANIVRVKSLRAWWSKHRSLDLIGLVLAIVLFYLAGRVLGGFVGRRIADRAERLMARVPVFKQIYPYVKQVVDFILGEKQIDFKRVALVQYPRKGIWALGFITGKPTAQWSKISGHDELVTLFIPSSPTPFTGYTITVPRCDVYELDITPEEAFRFTVSGGVLIPGQNGESINLPADNSDKKSK